MNDLQKLFIKELRDMYDAEQQIIKALPKMSELAESEELREGFNHHLAQTENQVRRLEEVFRLVGESPKRESCAGMEGIIDEGEDLADDFEDTPALDAALISAAQKVEHYEISSYGTLCTWAKELGHDQAFQLLKETLSEEKDTDHKLTELAETSRNLEAMNR